MTGPGETVTTLPLTPKSSSFFSSRRDFIFRFSSSTVSGRGAGSSRNFMEGSLKPLASGIKSNISCLGAGAGFTAALGVGALIFTSLGLRAACFFWTATLFLAFLRRSLILIQNVWRRSTKYFKVIQQRLPNRTREKPVAIINPTVQSTIRMIAAPVTLEYRTRIDFKGMPMTPPDE